MRIKKWDNCEVWVNAEKELDPPWNKGEHYHLTGTWGEEEVALYIDGECVDRNNQLPPAQPTLMAEVFTLNNDTPVDNPDKPTHCILRDLRIFNYPLNDAEVKEIYRNLHLNLVE